MVYLDYRRKVAEQQSLACIENESVEMMAPIPWFVGWLLAENQARISLGCCCSMEE